MKVVNAFHTERHGGERHGLERHGLERHGGERHGGERHGGHSLQSSISYRSNTRASPPGQKVSTMTPAAIAGT